MINIFAKKCFRCNGKLYYMKKIKQYGVFIKEAASINVCLSNKKQPHYDIFYNFSKGICQERFTIKGMRICNDLFLENGLKCSIVGKLIFEHLDGIYFDPNKLSMEEFIALL